MQPFVIGLDRPVSSFLEIGKAGGIETGVGSQDFHCRELVEQLAVDSYLQSPRSAGQVFGNRGPFLVDNQPGNAAAEDQQGQNCGQNQPGQRECDLRYRSFILPNLSPEQPHCNSRKSWYIN